MSAYVPQVGDLVTVTAIVKGQFSTNQVRWSPHHQASPNCIYELVEAAPLPVPRITTKRSELPPEGGAAIWIVVDGETVAKITARPDGKVTLAGNGLPVWVTLREATR